MTHVGHVDEAEAVGAEVAVKPLGHGAALVHRALERVAPHGDRVQLRLVLAAAVRQGHAQ